MHDRPHKDGAALHDDVAAEDGQLAEEGAALDLGVLSDAHRAGQQRVGVDLRPVAHPDARRHLETRHLHVDPALQDVGVRLEVARLSPDVLPVALSHVAVHRRAGRNQRREDVHRPVDAGPGLHGGEDLGLHDVDAGVHRVGEDLPPRRLLEEPLDAPVLARHDDAELDGVRHPGQADGDERPALTVGGDERAEVDVGQRVARHDQEGVVAQRGRRVPH